MSMFDDVLGFGRTSVAESMEVDTLEPEIAGMSLEEAADIDEDPMDFMLRVAYENEMNMMNLDAAIVAEEYMYLRENGQEMVYEEGKIKSVINRFKEWVKKLWGKIQSFFKAVFDKIESLVRNDKKFLEKYKKDAAGKTSGKMRGNIAYLKDHKANVSNAIELIAKIKTEVEDLKASNTSKDKDIIFTKLKIGDGSAKDILKAINTDLANSNTDLDNLSADEAIKILEMAQTDKSSLKKAYDYNKAVVNGMIKQAKTMEKDAKREENSEKASAIHSNIAIMNKLGSIMTAVDRIAVKTINTSRTMAKAVILSAIRKSNGAKESKNESASLIDTFEIM